MSLDVLSLFIYLTTSPGPNRQVKKALLILSNSSNTKRSRLDSVVTRPPATTGAVHRPPKLANWLHGRGCPIRDPNRGTGGGGGNRRWNRGYGGLENNSYRGQSARGRYARGRYARGRGERGRFGNQYW